jgi:ferric-dicitrate binding protein FerR (iron transport regulator)
MNCEEAENLISARVDGELRAGDAASVELDAHLAGCSTCSAAAEAMAVQDGALARAFAPARLATEAVAERVAATAVVAGMSEMSSARRRMRWIVGMAACATAACLALVAVTLNHRTRDELPGPAKASAPAAATVAQIALSTGEVFTCPSHAPADQPGNWQPAAAGAALAHGDRVRTSPSARVELLLADGSQVRLNGGSEARLDADRCVELTQGQLWSAVPQASQPLRVTAPAAPAGGVVTAVTSSGGRLDVACEPQGPVLTAVRGPAKVTDKLGVEAEVPPGTSMSFAGGVASDKGTPGDVLLATRWLNDLLVLKDPDDPELAARVAELLSRVKLESGSGNGPATRPASAPVSPGPVEQMIRAHGARWCDPLACHVRSPASQADRATRLAAARLLADLATPSTIGDLIALLPDADGEVRFYAVTALQRLTGERRGSPPWACSTDSPEAVMRTHKAWVAWWEQNKARYGNPAD